MELINDTIKTDFRLPAGRKDAYLKAILSTLRDFFSGKNSVRGFRNAYRFNVIRWSASNFRSPSLPERIGLFFRTGNPFRIVREDFNGKLARLMNRWEMDAVRKVSLSLIELGRTPLREYGRDIEKQLDRTEKAIRELQGYEGCPNMTHERLQLATYCYIFATPAAERFKELCPDELCEMLEQNGVDRKELCRQNYGGLLRHGETVLYETVAGTDGRKYLRPSGHVNLEQTTSGWVMKPSCPAVMEIKTAAVNFSEPLPPSRKVEGQAKGNKRRKSVSGKKSQKGIQIK